MAETSVIQYDDYEVSGEMDREAVVADLLSYFPSSSATCIPPRPHAQPVLIDLLLANLDQSQEAPSWPPSSVHDFLSDVAGLANDAVQLHAIVLYLLLACKAPRTTDFTFDYNLSHSTTTAVRAFFHLDQRELDDAVPALLSPLYVHDPAYTLRVLEILACDPQMVLTFWNLTLRGTQLDPEAEVAIVLDALCDATTRTVGISTAINLIRERHDEAERASLTHRVLTRAFGDNPAKLPVSHHLSHLLAIPFTPLEHDTIQDLIATPPGVAFHASLAASFYLTKLIIENQPVEALKFFASLPTALPGHEKRVELARRLESTLTAWQKSQVNLDRDIFDENASPPESAPTNRLSPSPAPSVAQPAWLPLPTSAPAPPPRSLLSVPSRSPAPQQAPPPSPSQLPLSASPFLRTATPLVGTADASRSSAIGKNFLRAVEQHGTSAPLFGNPASPSTSVKGFGSVRIANAERRGYNFSPSSIGPSSASWRDGSEARQDRAEEKADSSLPPIQMTGAIEKVVLQAQKQNERAQAASTPIAPLGEGPAPSRSAPATKRRNYSSQSSRPQSSTDAATEAPKRRKAAPLTSSRADTSLPPGAFPPSHGDEGQSSGGEEQDEEAPSSVKPAPKARRSKRASSAVPPSVSSALTTPARKTRAGSALLQDEGPASAVRRSTRKVASVSEQRGTEKPTRSSRTKK